MPLPKVSERIQVKRDRKDLTRALSVRARATHEINKTAAASRVAAIILRPLHQAAYDSIPSETLAKLAQGLKEAADSGSYDGGCYADDYNTAIGTVATREGINVKTIPPEVHARIRKLA